MKLVSEGTPVYDWWNDNAAWAGQVWVCEFCGCAWELEGRGDIDMITTTLPKWGVSPKYVRGLMQCQRCYRSIEVYSDMPEGGDGDE